MTCVTVPASRVDEVKQMIDKHREAVVILNEIVELSVKEQ